MINNGKASIENATGTLRISIPSKKNWFVLLFGTAWLGGWYFGFSSAFSMFSLSDLGKQGIVNGFMLFWLTGWTVSGLFVIFALLWGYFGQEQFTSDGSDVYLNKTIFGLGIKKRMEAPEIKNIRREAVNADWSGGNRWALWGLGPGKITFDYGLRTLSFGLGVDDAEAGHIVELMKRHFKR